MRLFYFLFALITILFGLASRHYASLLPVWMAKNTGDVLYATLVFWLIRLIYPAAAKYHAALAAFALCFLIELAKLYLAPWAEAIRNAPGGRLVFGYAYHASNLACYLIGTLLGYGLDSGILRVRRSQL